MQPANLPANSSFSTILPRLQLAIDSTSLGAYKTCPRYYQYSILLGWEPKGKSVHLLFGLWMHEGREKYYLDRWNGISHEDALANTIHWALKATWDSKLSRPWISNHSTKNRLTLIRTLVWYLDKYGNDDPLETVEVAPGKPAVEVSFSFGTGRRSQDGEEFLLCGHVDRVVKLNAAQYISDLKTTGSILYQDWFDQFTPDNQFTLYITAAQVVFHAPISSLIVDGIQILANGSRFQRGLVERKESQIEEWWDETINWWLSLMEQSARSNYYPQNDKACGNYGGCPYRPVCSKPPSLREATLQREYTRRVWDPLKVRGDI